MFAHHSLETLSTTRLGCPKASRTGAAALRHFVPCTPRSFDFAAASMSNSGVLIPGAHFCGVRLMKYSVAIVVGGSMEYACENSHPQCSAEGEWRVINVSSRVSILHIAASICPPSFTCLPT